MELTDIQKIAGQKLRKLRNDRNLSLRDMESVYGCTHTHISAMERGKQFISHIYLRKASEFFKVPTAYFTAATETQELKIAKIENILAEGGDLNEALTTAHELVDTAIKGEQLANAHNFVGRILYKLGRFREAKDAWDLMFREVEGQTDGGLQFSALINIALCFYALLDYDQTLVFCRKALDVCDSPDREPVALQLQANVYADMNDYRKAIKIHESILRTYKSQNNSLYILKSLHNIGDCQMRIGERQDARINLEEAYNLSHSMMNKEEIAKTAIDLSRILFELNNVERAKIILEESLLISYLSVSPQHVATMKFLLSKCVDDGNRKKLLESAYGDILNTDNFSIAHEIGLALGDLFLLEGDTGNSLKYYRNASEAFSKLKRR